MNRQPDQAPLLCPWRDYGGNEVHAGDWIVHPLGDRAQVVFDAAREGAGAWRAVYEDGVSLFLGNQINDRGQAIVEGGRGVLVGSRQGLT